MGARYEPINFKAIKEEEEKLRTGQKEIIEPKIMTEKELYEKIMKNGGNYDIEGSLYDCRI